jgi:hypothetical protein
MRCSLIILALLTGCSVSHTPTQPQAISLSELKSIKVSNRNCTQIDQWVDYAETQIQRRGLTGKHPEELNVDEREYNTTAKAIIWSLRIGCANPDRYATK